MRKKLSVIISAYYNEGSLPTLHEKLIELRQELDLRQMDLELVLIDDGSGDNSFQELVKIKEEHSETTLIKLTRNFGAVAASSTAFHYLTGDCFIVLAADLQDPPEQILKMVDVWLKGNKLVISVRKKRKDSLLSTAFTKVYYFFLRKLVFKNYPKGGYDLMLADKQILPHLQNLYGTVNYQLYAHWLGYKPAILEYIREERHSGKSRWTFRKRFNMFMDNMTGFSVVLIRTMCLFGIATSLVSFFYGLWMFTQAFFYQTEVPGFATLVVLISFSTSIILTTMAVMGEYLWRIFILSHKMPARVIDEVYYHSLQLKNNR